MHKIYGNRASIVNTVILSRGLRGDCLAEFRAFKASSGCVTNPSHDSESRIRVTIPSHDSEFWLRCPARSRSQKSRICPRRLNPVSWGHQANRLVQMLLGQRGSTERSRPGSHCSLRQSWQTRKRLWPPAGATRPTGSCRGGAHPSKHLAKQ